MARTGRWLIGSVALAGAMFFAVQPGLAGEDLRQCSQETLRGQYMSAGAGTLFPPAFGVTDRATVTVAGYSLFNGDGTGADHFTFRVNGMDVNAPPVAATTYTLNPDCTGTLTVLPDGPHFNIYVALDGSELTEISTDPGYAISGSERRVGRSR
jgi:hypothetical protein